MRAPAIVLVLLLALPVADAGWYWISYREVDGPGWYTETFQLTNPNATRIWTSFEVRSAGELTGHLVALYSDNGTLLRGATLFSEGGQRIEATLQNGDLRVTNEAVNQTATTGLYTADVFWTCDAACNPSRTFKLVITSGGDVESWRYAILTNAGTGIVPIANKTGTDAWAYTTRQFDGDVLHLQTPVGGIHKVDGASMSLRADDSAFLTFVKPDPSPDPAQMRVEGAMNANCPCFAGAAAPGDYTFLYRDQDSSGAEGLLTFADVDMS